MKDIANNKKVYATLFIIVFFGAVFLYTRVPEKIEIKNVASAIEVASTTEVIQSSFVSKKEISRGDTSKKQVIFTFDGGATTQSADTTLSVLNKHHVKGTFFLTGKMVEKNPDLTRKIAAAGHEIFSHTYDHKRLTTLSDSDITSELTKFESTLFAITNTSPKPYFRAPYGDRNSHVLDVAAKAGYESVYWTIDALDWEQLKGKTATEVENRILSHVAPGNIYLMHLGDTITGAILDDVFTKIESEGYKIVSLTQGI